MKSTKSRALLIALAASFCIIGMVGCSGEEPKTLTQNSSVNPACADSTSDTNGQSGAATTDSTDETDGEQSGAATADSTDETDSGQTNHEQRENRLVFIALFFSVLNFLATGWIWMRFLQKKRKRRKEKPDSPHSFNNFEESFSELDKQTATTVEKLEQQVTIISEQQMGLEKTVKVLEEKVIKIDPPPASNTSDTNNHGQNLSPKEAQKIHQPRTDSGSRTKQASQNISGFSQIATVRMTKNSQEEIWVGKNVAAVFSPSSQGDYWIVSPDNQRYYIILKDKAILNANNLKTLKILYDFVDQPKLSALKRHYDVLAEVKSSGSNEWELMSSGKLTFYYTPSVLGLN